MGRRFFRALLRVLPFDFRADYGREIERAFDEERLDAPGVTGRARVWAANVAALLAVGQRDEHVEHARGERQQLVRLSVMSRHTR